MRYKELIEAIRKEAEEKIKGIWKEAESEAEKVKEKRDQRLEALKREYEERFRAEIERRKNQIMRKTEREASLIRLRTQEELSKKLFNIALGLLQDLRKGPYRENFETIAKEIPYSNWVTVRINPQDVMYAKKIFPEAEVISDPSIIGGLVVINSHGNVIINTLEKRLERLWPQILPEIIKTIEKAYGTSNR